MAVVHAVGQPENESERKAVAYLQVYPDLSSELDEILARMCAFRPEGRYADLRKVVKDLATIG